MVDQDIINQLSQEFRKRLSSELNTNSSNISNSSNFSIQNQNLQQNMIHSYEYEEFKKYFMPRPASFYEKMCIEAYKIFPIKVSENREKKFEELFERCHLSLTASHVMSASLLFGLLSFVLTLFLGSIYGVLANDFNAIGFFALIGALIGGFVFYWFYSYPKYLVTIYRLKAANSLVESLFYIVTYLRHTSNLERAIDFAAEHLPPPLSLDFKKILWDFENGKYSSVKESIYHYLKKWEADEPTYCQAMSVVITSLEEGNEQRRLELLDNALDILLTGTFEKMLKYTHDLHQPVTMIHMMGVVLPMLATVMLPLAVSFMPEIRWYHIAMLYNFLLPVFLIWKSKQILATRPSNAGFSLWEINLKTNTQKILFNSILILLFFVIIGIGPISWMKWLLVDETNVSEEVGGKLMDILLFPELTGNEIQLQLLEYRVVGDPPRVEGPYSFISAIIGLLIVFGIGFSLSYYYLNTTKQSYLLKEKARKVEEEFLAILIQLGNRLNEGIPLEIAFRKVYETIGETLEIRNFFQIIIYNLENRGMGVEEAIFDPQYGAINYYPSPLLSSVMKILVDSSRKGPRIAGTTMINIAEYLKKVREINRRVNDLLAESLSGMKSIINFMGPVLNAIVIALSAMISTVVVSLQDMMRKMSTTGLVDASQAGVTNLLSEGMPSFYFHVINGLYVLSVVYVLSELISVLENGPDEVVKNHIKGKNLKRSSIFYFIISATLTFLFCFIAIIVISTGFTK